VASRKVEERNVGLLASAESRGLTNLQLTNLMHYVEVVRFAPEKMEKRSDRELLQVALMLLVVPQGQDTPPFLA